MGRLFKAVFVGVLLVFWMSGCVTDLTDSVAPQAFQVEKAKQVEPAKRMLAGGDSIELSVEVDGAMEISFYRTTVNAIGFVTLPLVGDVMVGDMNIEEARRLIGHAYSKFYVNEPVIMLSVGSAEETTEFGFVTVLGRVGQPGRVALSSGAGINLSEAIQRAGGFASSAKTTEIRVTRVNKRGKKLQTHIDFDKIGREGNVAADIKLINGDIVFVPERIF